MNRPGFSGGSEPCEVGGQPGDAAGVGASGRDRRRPAARDLDWGCAAYRRAGAGEPGTASGQRDPEGGERFFRSGTRPATAEVVKFIDKYRDQLGGIEPICRVLGFAPSTYHAAAGRAPSPGAVRDAWLMREI